MRETNYLSLAVTGAALLLVFNLPPRAAKATKTAVREAMAPYQGALGGFAVTAGDLAGALRQFGQQHAVRDRLLEEVVRLRQEVQGSRQLDEENARLRAGLDFAKRSHLQLVACEVISRDDISGWWQTVRLNKGTTAGIEPDMAVLAVDGLVGRTTEVTAHTCDVLLITDRNCKISARFLRSGDNGIVNGGGVDATGQSGLALLFPPEPRSIEFIPQSSGVQDGDALVTSGLGGVFPADLLIGQAVGVTNHPSALYRQAQVRPAADLNHLRVAFVVLNRAAGPARPEGSPGT